MSANTGALDAGLRGGEGKGREADDCEDGKNGEEGSRVGRAERARGVVCVWEALEEGKCKCVVAKRDGG